MAINFPNIDPVIASFGGLAIRWYSMAYVLGIILGYLLFKKLYKIAYNKKLPEKFGDDFFLYAILGIVLGGRLGYVLFYNLAAYLSNPLEILQIWHGGMSFHGGMLGFIGAIILLSRKYKMSFFKITDLLCCCAPIGLFFGRIANFINAELYGRVTDAWVGVLFPNNSEPRHPSQIYEALLEGFLLFIILNICFRFRLYRFPMMLSGIFLAGYGIARFIVEFFREPDVQVGYILTYFSMGQMLCIPMVMIGIFFMVKSCKN
jgi:phosphatidylglycerol---prolipoprotein diacylglyceryl transferase